MQNFDYDRPAELFSNAGKRRHSVGYRRFESGAEAVRFVVEEVPGFLIAGVVLESEEERFDHIAIRALYDSPKYPLVRDAPSN